MNKSQLVGSVNASTSQSRRVVEEVVDVLFDTIIAEVRSGRKVSVIGFGSFNPIGRAARIGRNPRTGAVVPIPASKGVRFATGSTFKSALNPKEGAPMAVKRAATRKKATAKKAPARKTAARKSTAKKAPARKTAARKATASKTAAKKAVKKAVRKASAKKTTAKRAVKKAVRKSTAKRAPARKTAAKRATKRAPARKTAANGLRPARRQPSGPPSGLRPARRQPSGPPSGLRPARRQPSGLRPARLWPSGSPSGLRPARRPSGGRYGHRRLRQPGRTPAADGWPMRSATATGALGSPLPARDYGAGQERARGSEIGQQMECLTRR